MSPKNIQNPFSKEFETNDTPITQILDHRISDYFKKVSTVFKDASLFPDILQRLDDYPLFEGQAMYCSHLPNGPTISYQRGIKTILGYEQEQFTTDVVMNWFHPNQAELVKRIIKGIVFYGLSPDHYGTDAYLLLYVKVRKKDGSYLPILRQTHFFGNDVTGKATGAISIITDMSGLHFPDRVEWKIKGTNIDEEIFRSYITEAFSDLFSSREKEILNLIEKRKTSLEIANKLYISKNTVDTHRRNMLKKANCTDSFELIGFAKEHGIL